MTMIYILMICIFIMLGILGLIVLDFKKSNDDLRNFLNNKDDRDEF